MPAETLEVSTKQISVTKGTPQEDQTFATIGGAVKAASIEKIERIGDVTTYTIIVVHDNAGSTILQWSYNEVSVTKGTDILDQTKSTNNGQAAAIDIDLIEINGNVRTYGIVDVHPST